MAKKTIFKLQFETDFRIVGLFCSERDYRLSWLINGQLAFGFKRVADFDYMPSKSKQSEIFSVFLFHDEFYRCEYYLVSNRSNHNNSLFVSPAGLDYLLLVKTDDYRFDFRALLKNLRTVSQITAAYVLDEVLGRQKEAFLYDFELFADRAIDGLRRKESLTWIRERSE